MFNYGFELFVNLFQGVMFTVFCYKFLTHHAIRFVRK